MLFTFENLLNKITMYKLTELELEQIKGGVVTVKMDDVLNDNTTVLCKCFFDNTPQVIENRNSANGCACSCN